MKTKRYLMCFVAFLLMVISFGGVAVYAKTKTASTETTISSTSSTAVVSSQGEVTEWYYRTVNSRLQRRLWSVTYGVWLTDWEWV